MTFVFILCCRFCASLWNSDDFACEFYFNLTPEGYMCTSEGLIPIWLIHIMYLFLYCRTWRPTVIWEGPTGGSGNSVWKGLVNYHMRVLFFFFFFRIIIFSFFFMWFRIIIFIAQVEMSEQWPINLTIFLPRSNQTSLEHVIWATRTHIAGNKRLTARTRKYLRG